MSLEESLAEEVAGWGPPLPMKDPGAYTADRVRKGLQYAQTLLAWGLKTSPTGTSRKITPMTAKFLELYEVTCQETLQKLEEKSMGAFTPPNVKRAVYEVYKQEETLKSHQFLQTIATPDIRNTLLLEPMITLRKFELFTRYSNFLRLLSKRLRAKAFELGIANAENINVERRWTVFQQSLVDELKVIGPIAASLATEQVPSDSRLLVEEDLKDAPTLRAIYNTAEALSIDWLLLVHAVQTYVLRDQMMHSELDEHLYQGDFGKMAEMLRQDSGQLPKLFDPDDVDVQAFLSIIIKYLELRWFYGPEEGVENHRHWIVKSALVILSDQRRENALIEDPEDKIRAEEAQKQREENLNRMLMREAFHYDMSEELIRCLFRS